MKTIQIVLDEASLRAADRAAKRAKVNRSALFRTALAYYLERERIRDLEEQHRRGYENKPVAPDEFGVWDRIVGWPER
jgi:metal-responsive CopG/Arc/MetJ family transcriptional regulator